MPYTDASGVQIPVGTDAFNPTPQFKTWQDGNAGYNTRLSVPLDSDRTSLAAPKLRDGLEVYVEATKKTWQYQDTTWVDVSRDDTGWITPALSKGANVAGNPFGYRRLNGVVYLRGRVSGLLANDNMVTLPTGFRPDAGADNVLLLDAGAAGGVRLNIQSTGVINVATIPAGGPGVTFTGADFIADVS